MIDSAPVLATSSINGSYVVHRDKRYCCYDAAGKFIDAYSEYDLAALRSCVLPQGYEVEERVGNSFILKMSGSDYERVLRQVFKLVDGGLVYASTLFYDRYLKLRLTWQKEKDNGKAAK